VQTKRAIGQDGKITALECVRVDWQLGDGGQMKLVEVPGSEFTIKADLVLLAMGFVGPKKAGLVEQSGVELDCARQCEGAADQLSDQQEQDLLLRRHAARTIAGGVGDPRRPPVRQRCRPVPDGKFGASANPHPSERRPFVAVLAALPSGFPAGVIWRGRLSCLTEK
jgi:hypothetical protein